MPEPRKPQDHLSKVEDAPDVEEYFTFEIGGKSYTMPEKTLDVINTGFIRRNRRRDEVDYLFTAIEALAGGPEAEDTPEYQRIFVALDPLHRPELTPIIKAFQEHLGATLGE